MTFETIHIGITGTRNVANMPAGVIDAWDYEGDE